MSQRVNNLYVKFELLNSNYTVIDYIVGQYTSGTLTIDSTADCVRTLNAEFYVKDKSFLVNINSKIWFNKNIRLYIGIQYLRTKEIIYYPCGLFVFDEQTYEYDATTNRLTIKTLDLMSKLTGTRNGQLTSLVTKIPVGSNIRDAMISVVTQLGFVGNYLIDNISSTLNSTANTVPYDLTFSESDTVYTILCKLRDLYAGYHMYFDDTCFVCKQYPTHVDDDIALSYEQIIKYGLVISEQRDNKFEDVKNCIIVYGNQISVDRYTETCTANGIEYDAVFSSPITSLETGMNYAVKLPRSNVSNATLKIDSLTAYPIVNSDGTALNAGTINGYSVFSYKSGKFYYLGQYQVEGIAMLVQALPSIEQQAVYKAQFGCDNIAYVINPDSPYCIEKIGSGTSNPYKYGLMWITKSGDNYSQIYSNDLAIERAKYELWKVSKLVDTVELKMRLIPWLIPDVKISYKSKITGEIEQYIIQKIEIPLLDGTMTVTLQSFYPLYEE